MIRVLVVDDQMLIRRAVADILAPLEGIEVVGDASNGLEALAQAAAVSPDVVVMDIRMPELDGIQATAAIRANPALEGVRVLILTTFEEDEYVVAALRAGASGFIGKGAEPDEIGHAVRAIHAGESLLSPVATKSLIERYLLIAQDPRGPAPTHPELDQLTAREREVLLLVAGGQSNEIGRAHV